MKYIFVLVLLVSTFASGQLKTLTSVGGNYSQGNAGLLLGSAQSVLQFDSTKLYTNISPYFCYSQVMSGGQWVTKQRECYLMTSFMKKTKHINLYLFTNTENSFQKKFNIRASIGLGIGKYFNFKDFRLSTSIALMPEYYSSFTNQNERSLRASLRVHLQTKGSINFSMVTQVQPAIFMDPFIGYGNNFNLRSVNTLNIPINNNLSIGAQVLVNTCTLSEYTTTIKATDITSSFILTYKR